MFARWPATCTASFSEADNRNKQRHRQTGFRVRRLATLSRPNRQLNKGQRRWTAIYNALQYWRSCGGEPLKRVHKGHNDIMVLAASSLCGSMMKLCVQHACWTVHGPRSCTPFNQLVIISRGTPTGEFRYFSIRWADSGRWVDSVLRFAAEQKCASSFRMAFVDTWYLYCHCHISIGASP